MYILSHVEFRSDTDRLFNGENRVKKQCIVTNTMYVMWDTCSLNTQDIVSNIQCEVGDNCIEIGENFTASIGDLMVAN